MLSIISTIVAAVAIVGMIWQTTIIKALLDEHHESIHEALHAQREEISTWRHHDA